MRGVHLLGNRQLEVIDWPDPEPGPGEVLVAMKAAAVCGSDLHRYRGEEAQPLSPGTSPAASLQQRGKV